MNLILRAASAACLAFALTACGGSDAPSEPEPKAASLAPSLETRLEEALAAKPEAKALAVAILRPTGAETAAVGPASDDAPLTAETPLRIASNTKTYVAATVLKLYERGEIDLDAAIAGLIDPELDEMLRGDGYDTDAITVRHLLMHVSGMPDHADDTYAELALSDTSRVWTRADQVRVLVEHHDPLGAPGELFTYSDTGYVILGDILERATGEPLHAIVRKEMKFDEIGLSATWWEKFETPPAGAAPRARQYLEGMDVTDVDASVDLYGGGGLISSPHDMARFMEALFEGEIYDDPATLELMLAAPGHPEPDKYRIGLRGREVDGVMVYAHSGFWGTYALYAPDIEAAAAGAALDQTGYWAMRETLEAELVAPAQRP